MSTRAVRCGVLAYGRDARRHREALVALLTLRAYTAPATEILVLTDCPSAYRWIADQVAVHPLTDGTLTAWCGPTNDRFRPKLEALCQLSRDGAHAILADTDTMARVSVAPLIEHLEAGGFLLYEREYPIARAPRRGDRSLKREVVGKSWAGIAADEHTWMWNGGVIGVSGRHPDAATRALAAYDELRQASRHFALEQLAYSIVFPAYGSVRAANDCFIHYWANRAWFDRRIERFLSTALMEQLTAAQAGERLREQPIEGALDGRLPSWQRRLRKLLRIETDDDAERFD